MHVKNPRRSFFSMIVIEIRALVHMTIQQSSVVFFCCLLLAGQRRVICGCRMVLCPASCFVSWTTSKARILLKNKKSSAFHSAKCGTLRKNRKYIPDGIKNAMPQPGQYEFRRCRSALVFKFNDKREVLIIGSQGGDGRNRQTRSPQTSHKPSIIHDYIRHMGGVDRNDELIGYYTCLQKTLKWYKKHAIHFFEEALLNAFIVYRQEDPQGHKLHLLISAWLLYVNC